MPGEIVESGSKEAIFDHPTHPYTLGLFRAVPHLDDDADRLSPIAGLPPDPSDLPRAATSVPAARWSTEECRSETIPLREIAPGHFCRCIKVTDRRGGGSMPALIETKKPEEVFRDPAGHAACGRRCVVLDRKGQDDGRRR